MCQVYEKGEIIFGTEYVQEGMQYCCRLNYCNGGPYYDWIFVLYYDNKTYPWKLIVYICGSFNEFDGYHLIVEQAYEKHNIDSVLC